MARRGWRRLGSKRFRYVDARDRAIDDVEQLARIEALAIPPAWREVWISPNARAKLQATGVDAAGRKQYLYHESFRAAQERAKFERLLAFARGLPALRARMERDLRLGGYEEDWACALAVSLVNSAWFRVGTDRHARRSRTYGITTLTRRHVTVSDSSIVFRFRAKNRRLVRREVESERLAREMRALLALPGGGRVFRFERDGEPVNLTAPRLNEYIGAGLGEEFTAKDFRTWGGTLVAAVTLAQLGPAPDEREATRAVAAAMRRVGDELGNTPAVARGSYVSPLVVERYFEGRTLDDFRPPAGSRRPARLSADERALVRLLRSRPAERR